MALEDKKEKEYTKFEEPKEAIALPAPEVAIVYKVLEDFVLDKQYRVGNKIELLNGKVKDTLISNKFIK